MINLRTEATILPTYIYVYYFWYYHNYHDHNLCLTLARSQAHQRKTGATLCLIIIHFYYFITWRQEPNILPERYHQHTVIMSRSWLWIKRGGSAQQRRNERTETPLASLQSVSKIGPPVRPTSRPV